MITVERLPEEEFDVLLSIEEGYKPNPETSIAVVARQDGEIIGRLLLLFVAHVEGAWVHDRFRNGTILDKMTKEVEKQAKEAGLSTVFAYSRTQQMDDYIQRLGYEPTALRVFKKDI